MNRTCRGVIDAISESLDVPREHMLSRSRKARIVWARQVAMYVMRHYLGMTYSDIGSIFGRHHTTAMHSCQTVNDQMDTGSRIYNQAIQDALSTLAGAPQVIKIDGVTYVLQRLETLRGEGE